MSAPRGAGHCNFPTMKRVIKLCGRRFAMTPIKSSLKCCVLVACAILLNGALKAQTAPKLPAGVTAVTEVEGIKEYRLENGLQVLLFPDMSKPTTTVNITYRVGSRHENYGETGMAHLLEHLLFKGTPKHPALWKEMADRGFNNNGTTWLDRTNYYESFPAKDESLKWALEMEADRMVNSRIDAEDLKTEMTVVRNEYEMGENNPFQVMLKRMGSVAYDWHSYGKSTIGNRSDIENVGIENLRAFYKTHYQPDNATLLVGGKFDAEKTLALIAGAFGPIPKSTRARPKLWTVEPAQDGERSFAVRRAGDVQILLAGFKVPPGTHPDYAPLRVLANVLGDDASGRLKKALVDPGLAAQAFAFSNSTYDPGLFYAGAVLRAQQDLTIAQNTMMTELGSVATISAEDVTRAQNALLKDAEETVRAPDRLSIGLSESIAEGDWRLFFFQRDLIKKVSPADVTRVAKEYLKRDNRTIGTFIPTATPERAVIGTRPDLVALLKDYKGDPNIKTGEAFDPSPSNIEARTQRFTLANGMQVALVPKSNRGEAVHLALALRAGSLQSLAGQTGARAMTASMMMRGTSTMSRVQIKDKFDALKTSASISDDSASLESTRSHITEAIKLMTHVMKEANFPASEFAEVKQEMLTSLESQRREPQTLATDKLTEHLRRYGLDDPRTQLTSRETIMRTEQTTREQVLAYHKRFIGGSNGQLSVVGDFDPVAMKSLLEAELGTWKTAEPYVRIPSDVTPPKAAEFTLNAPDKENGFVLAVLPLAINDTHADYPALMLANFIVGENTNSRLFTRIREKDGLSYYAGSQLQVPAFEPSGNFAVFAIAAPPNVSKVVAAAKEELVRAQTVGFSADEVQKAKDAWLEQRKSARAEDAGVASRHVALMHAGRTFAFTQALDEKVAALKPEALSAAFKKYIAVEQMTFIRALDESKVK
jgi:zinc protease